MNLKMSPTHSPSADYIYQLAAIPALGNKGIEKLFAARACGLYYSTDGGQTWQLAYENISAETILPTLAVAISPSYKLTPQIFAGLNGAILYSIDGGSSWQLSHLPDPPPVITCLAISPCYAEDGIVFAGTSEDGVLVSKDYGKNWNTWNFGLLDLNVLCLAISPDFAVDETLYSGTSSGLFRSTNGGRAWKEISLPTGFDAILSLTLSPKYTQDHALFIGTENRGLLLSKDQGKSWQTINEITANQPVNAILLSPRFPDEPVIVILHGGTVLITSDGGKTWKPWQRKKLEGKNASAILALLGFDKDVFIGFEDGSVIKI